MIQMPSAPRRNLRSPILALLAAVPIGLSACGPQDAGTVEIKKEAAPANVENAGPTETSAAARGGR